MFVREGLLEQGTQSELSYARLHFFCAMKVSSYLTFRRPVNNPQFRAMLLSLLFACARIHKHSPLFSCMRREYEPYRIGFHFSPIRCREKSKVVQNKLMRVLRHCCINESATCSDGVLVVQSRVARLKNIMLPDVRLGYRMDVNVWHNVRARTVKECVHDTPISTGDDTFTIRSRRVYIM